MEIINFKKDDYENMSSEEARMIKRRAIYRIIRDSLLVSPSFVFGFIVALLLNIYCCVAIVLLTLVKRANGFYIYTELFNQISGKEATPSEVKTILMSLFILFPKHKVDAIKENISLIKLINQKRKAV